MEARGLDGIEIRRDRPDEVRLVTELGELILTPNEVQMLTRGLLRVVFAVEGGTIIFGAPKHPPKFEQIIVRSRRTGMVAARFAIDGERATIIEASSHGTKAALEAILESGLSFTDQGTEEHYDQGDKGFVAALVRTLRAGEVFEVEHQVPPKEGTGQ